MTPLTASPVPRSTVRSGAISAALGLLSGSVVANGVPHSVFGLLGLDHTTPFGTAATTNLWWGLTNLVVGVALSAPPAARRAYLPYSIGVAAGALGTAVSLLVLWS